MEVDVSYEQPMSIVLRFPDVAISRAELEAAFAVTLDRFGPSRQGPTSYAQLNVSDEGEVWANLVELADRIGPALLPLVRDGQLGQPSADVALCFYDDRVTTSLLIPKAVALALGRWGFDIGASVYLTSRTDDI